MLPQPTYSKMETTTFFSYSQEVSRCVLVGMDRLPVEVLTYTCDYLDYRTLVEFSLVNRRSRAISSLRKFRTVRVPFSSPESLNLNVAKCANLVRSSGSFKYVHQLMVVAANLYRLDRISSFARFRDIGDRPLDPRKYSAIDQSTSELVTEDSRWQDLTNFIKSLSALDELTWACMEQIPPCILRRVCRSCSHVMFNA